jgi:hypothetical protein
MSNLRDIMSPLSLIWRKFDIDLRDIVDKVGCLEGLWHDKYDPTVEDNKLFDEITHGIFSEMFMAENQCSGLVKAKNIYDESGLKVWCLSPTLVEAAGHAASWSSEHGQNVVSSILGLLAVKRTLRTRLMLPDGNLSFHGADLLPMVVSTEELNFDTSCRGSVKTHGRHIATNSFMALSSGMEIPPAALIPSARLRFLALEAVFCIIFLASQKSLDLKRFCLLLWQREPVNLLHICY